MLKKLATIICFCSILTGATMFLVKTETVLDQEQTVYPYKPYVLGEKITFYKGGNSTYFVEPQNGWGGQGDEFTFTIGKNSTIQLFVQDGYNQHLKVNLKAFGLYSKNATHQDLEVYANETRVKILQLQENDEYMIRIPANVMVSNKLDLRFHVKHPYIMEENGTELGFSIYELKINKDYFRETKIKIGRKIKAYFSKQEHLTEQKKQQHE